MDSKLKEFSYKVLKKYWWYNTFREFQEPVINSILNMKDTFAIIPTWWWKSLCFQVPWILLNWLTIVISPLIALMKDQVNNLKDKWINWAFLNSQLNNNEKKEVFSQLLNGQLKFLYVSPERFCNEQFIDLLNNIPISMITIDEAHMLIETVWFRDQFAEIWKYIDMLKSKQLINFPTRKWKIIISAFTATINKEWEEIIKNSLQMTDPYILRIENERNNLLIKTYNFNNDKEKIVALIKLVISLDSLKWSKIIFWMTRKDVKKLSEMIKVYWYSADYFHWDMSVTRKNSVFKKFLSWKLDWICATNAFGMWIDKWDIRVVIHYYLTFDNTLKKFDVLEEIEKTLYVFYYILLKILPWENLWLLKEIIQWNKVN